MSPDEKVLVEAERWFRALLRGASVRLKPHEIPLFSALAERQNIRGSIFVPKDPAALVEPTIRVTNAPVAMETTTLRPSAMKQQGLIERSKRPTGSKK